MHWLQTLDTGLFDFINQSLSNPLFDRLMPVLSGVGVHWFIPLAVAIGLAMLCFGDARARLCALMIMLVVALGDPLVDNTIKHAIARPRPYVTLPEARLFGVGGEGYVPPAAANGAGLNMAADAPGRNSMPSSHAANWFAMTMIAFLFYRRSAWFMLPMALAVSFSRVYNGVHYPGDVLAGAILGGGYAAALAVTFETAWQWFGKKWFPVWHAQLPSLLNAEGGVRSAESKNQSSTNSELRTPNSEREWLRLGYILIFAMLIARWIYVASGTIDLEKDEAYQWLWSKHLALSFYSKPPGIAVIQFVSTSLFGDTQFGVRFFAPLFAAILSVMVLRFFAREINARAGFWLLLIVTATPLLSLGTILMTIDPPLVLCWMWAVVAGWRATQPDGRTRDWLVVGLAMGLGFLCKYTAACQIACWAALFTLWKPARAHLRRPGPWLALLVFLVCTLPVLIWNTQHGWVTVRHVAGDASLHKPWHLTLRFFGDFLFTQGLLLNPILFAGMLWATVGFWKRWRVRPLWLYLFCMGAPLFLGYWLYSLHSRILPNWPVTAVPPLFCLMAAYWGERLRAGSKWVKPFLAIGIALGIFVVAMMYQSNLIGKITGDLLPGEKDPLRRVRAWKPTAALVDTERKKLEAEGKPAFIIADHYGMTGLFSFYLPQARAALQSEPLVYCVDSDEPVNQFYFWPQYDYRAQRKGQNAIFVTELDPYPLESDWLWKWVKGQPVNYAETPPPSPKPPRMLKEFESVTDLGGYEIKLGDRVFRRVHLWACYNLR
ncbi:MAG: glycosyltransferase family 39 protein [Verrucomicrobiota bacterium]|jgi:membrane-associated phospholipid phosphatase